MSRHVLVMAFVAASLVGTNKAEACWWWRRCCCNASGGQGYGYGYGGYGTNNSLGFSGSSADMAFGMNMAQQASFLDWIRRGLNAANVVAGGNPGVEQQLSAINATLTQTNAKLETISQKLGKSTNFNMPEHGPGDGPQPTNPPPAGVGPAAPPGPGALNFTPQDKQQLVNEVADKVCAQLKPEFEAMLQKAIANAQAKTAPKPSAVQVQQAP